MGDLLFLWATKMATSRKDVNQKVKIDIEQVGAEGLQEALKVILLKLEAIPQTTKGKVNPAITSLVNNLNEVAQTFAKNKLGSDEWVQAIKKVQVELQTIKILSSGLKLFEQADLNRGTEALREQLELARQIAQAGKDARGESSLQTDMRARYKVQQAKDEEKFYDGVRAEEKRTSDLKIAEDARVLKEKNKNRTKSAPKLQPWELNDIENARLFNSMGNGNYKGQEKFTFRSEEQMKTHSAQIKAWMEENVQIERGVVAERQYQEALRARYTLQQGKQAERDARPTAAQRSAEARMGLATGEGAASLMVIQAALIANATLLNGAINTIKQTIDFSIQLEASFRNVEAVIGTTKSEMIGLETTIKQVAVTTKFSALEVSEAALTLGQAGLSAKQISESILPVVTLANAAGSSIANAVDLVTSVIGVFDKNAGDVADVANKITQASNGSKVSIEKLALGFQYAGNTAAQLGISFEEVTAAMAAMSNAGIKSGSTMGTGLRQFLTEVQKPSEAFLETLRRVGLSISDLDFKSKGFIGVIKTLKDSGFVASDAIQSFDVRSAAAFNALLARPDDLQAQYDSLNGSTAAVRANEIQMESLSSQAARLTNILGVLSSTGFDPVVKAVTSLVRTLGNALETLTEFEGTLKVIGTLLAGLAGAAVWAWLASLGGGFMTLVGGAGAALTAITGFSGGLTALMGTLAAVVPPAAIFGAAIVAVIAAFSLYSSASDRLNKALDESKAAMSRASGSAKEKEEAITSLDKRLEMLSAREGVVQTDSEQFKSIVEESKLAMERWGYSIEGTVDKFETLRTKLKEVKKALEEARLGDLRDVEKNANNVLQGNKEKSALSWKELSNTYRKVNPEGRADSQLFKDFINSIPPGQLRTANEDALKVLSEGGDLGKMGLGSVLESNLATYLNSKGGRNASFYERTSLKAVKDSLEKFNLASSDTRRAEIDYGSASRNTTEATNKIGFLRRMQDSGLDFEDSLVGKNLMTEAVKGLPKEDQKDAVKINTLTKQIAAERVKELENIQARAMELAKTDSEKEYVKAEIRAAQEKARRYVIDSAPAAKAQGDREDRWKGDDTELARINNQIKKGVASKQDIARGEDLIRQKYDKKFQRETISETDPEELASYRARADRQAKEEIESFRTNVQAKASSMGSKVLKDTEESYAAVISAKMRESKAARARANKNMSLEEIDSLMDEGLDKIAEAKKLEVESNVRKYGSTSEIAKNHAAATDDKYEAAAQAYIASFSGLIENAVEAIYGISKKIKEIDAHIKKITNDAEARLYLDNEGLRANSREQAKNSGPVSGRNRSSVDAFYTNRDRERLDLDAANRNIAEKTAERDAIEALRQELLTIQAKGVLDLANAKGQRDTLIGGRERSQITSTEDLTKLGSLDGLVNSLTKTTTEGASKLEDYTKKIAALRDTVEDWELKKIGLTPGEEAPQTWDSLYSSMEKVLGAFNQMSSEANVFKTLEDGFMGVAQSIGGEMANAFAGIVSGTMSVSDAFRSMAGNIIKAMIQVLAQALAMQAVKGILGMFLPSLGVSATPVSGGGFGGWSVTDLPPMTPANASFEPSSALSTQTTSEAMGSSLTSSMANNSMKAVSAMASSVAPVQPQQKAQENKRQGEMNIWIVSPDQAQGVGPDDVIVTVSDNISRGGSLKQLIKTVAMGG